MLKLIDNILIPYKYIRIAHMFMNWKANKLGLPALYSPVVRRYLNELKPGEAKRWVKHMINNKTSDMLMCPFCFFNDSCIMCKWADTYGVCGATDSWYQEALRKLDTHSFTSYLYDPTEVQRLLTILERREL